MFFTILLRNWSFTEKDTNMERNVFLYGLLIFVLLNLVAAGSSGKFIQNFK